MTTPTTLEIARKFAEELVGNYDTARLILTLADQVEALIKERDSIAACYEAREEEAHQLSERIIKLTKERDALALCVDQWRVDFHELRLEHDALAAAAKLALDVCIDMRRHGDQRSVAMAIGAEAALYQAGVQ